jgi:hypothetical protein
MNKALGLMRWTPVALAVLLSLAAILILFRDLNIFPPQTGYDECFFLFPYERSVAYGDFSLTVSLEQFANNGNHAQSPPLVFAFRLALHNLLHSGIEIARFISAAEFVILALLLGVTARRLGASPALSVLGVGLFLSFPTVFLFARTVRSEQDVFFLGCLSLFCLMLVPPESRWRRWAVGASGLLAGTVCCMHPLGVIFPLGAMLAALPKMVDAGRLRHLFRAAKLWLPFFLLPVLATILYLTSDYDNFRAYMQGIAIYSKQHNALRVEAFSKMYDLPMPGLPEQTRAVINTQWAGLVPFATTSRLHRWGPLLLGGVMVLGVIGAFVSLAGLWRRKQGPDSETGKPAYPRLATVWFMGLLAAVAVIGVYPANNDYVLYINGLAWAASYFTLAGWSGGARHTALRTGVVLFAFFLTCWNLHYLYKVSWYHGQPASAGAPLRNQVALETADLIGIDTKAVQGPKVYGDFLSWPGAGRRYAPLFEYLIAEAAELQADYDGVVVSQRWYSDFVTTISNFAGTPIQPDERQERMRQLLAGHSFTGALLVEGHAHQPNDTLLWFTRKPANDPVFVRFLRDGTVVRYLGEKVAVERYSCPKGKQNLLQQLRLPAGQYAIMVTGETLSQSSLQQFFGENKRILAMAAGASYFPHEFAGALMTLDVGEAGSVTVEVQTEAEAAGTMLLHCWRLRPHESAAAVAGIGPSH